MEEGNILLDYIKKGIANGNEINDLRVNAIKRGYSKEEFDLALRVIHETQNEEQPIKERKSILRHIFGIPSNFIFPLTWTIFFAIIGITVQSFISGEFSFVNFFTSNLLEWLKKFNFFSDSVSYSGIWALIGALAKEVYYFGFVGGILSLLWVFISWVLSLMKR